MWRFEEYLRGQGNVYYPQIPDYLKWVKMYLNFATQETDEKDSSETVRSFTEMLGLRYEAWQVSQAQDAVRRYVYYLSREENKDRHAAHIPVPVSGFGSLEEQSRKIIRLRQLSYQTEKTYLQWLKRFYEYLKGGTPTADALRSFLSYLAVNRRVSAATQNQAFNALLCLFGHVLFIEVRGLDDAVASRKRRRLPVMLTKAEVSEILEQLSCEYLLMAKILYGARLPFSECVSLREQGISSAIFRTCSKAARHYARQRRMRS